MATSTSDNLIRDRVVNKLGFTRFLSAAVTDDDKSLRVKYVAGAEYEIPMEYVRTWYSKGPHEKLDQRGKSAAKIEDDDDQMIVELTLKDGSHYLIAWDVVLMACEPRYEHFGGFTDQSKANTASWLERHGSFRIDTSEERSSSAES